MKIKLIEEVWFDNNNNKWKIRVEEESALVDSQHISVQKKTIIEFTEGVLSDLLLKLSNYASTDVETMKEETKKEEKK